MKSHKKITLLLPLLFLIIAFVAVIIAFYKYKSNPNNVENISQIELITNKNRHFIGKEVHNSNVQVHNDLEKNELNSPTTSESELENNIPNNPICFATANDLISPGATIQEIDIAHGITPEIIIPNGAMGIFSQGDSLGWDCKTGDILSWKFEKYPMENKLNQSLGIGYIKDGVMYEMQVYTDSLDGEYQLNIPSDGIYHIYFICASADPISLKEGEITQKN